MNAVHYNVVVVGGGHAGAEAAWAAARLGARTALVTFDRVAIGRPSCNPAIGGLGKGQIVREIDALGGLMGLVTDEAGIQFRVLNRRKGPAVRAPRAQIDSTQYPAVLQRYLRECPNLDVLDASVEMLLTEPPSPPCAPPSSDNGARTGTRRIVGVELHDGRRISAEAVVITSGTFLRGLMHTGETRTNGGRAGEAAAVGLSASLTALGLELGRLKTGTPPRVRRDTVDFSALAEQPGDEQPAPFSFMTDRITTDQVCCWLSSTNPAIHDLIRANLHRAPMFSGQIESRGPRYCPSIEDKVVRFADKTSHQIFIEPEGRDSDRLYLNGISTSLPFEVQQEIVRRVPGLERAEIVQWGYAVEYDFVLPHQMDASLMSRDIRGLFFAGQVNGTSGYEEAAGQGLLAGINAARLVSAKPPVILRRDESYIGVLVDDLVTQELIEPYRMFTSRAEHRLHLRCDNADARLTPLAREVGLVDDHRWARYETRQAALGQLLTALDGRRVDGRTARDWLKRPDTDAERLVARFPELAGRNEPDTWDRAVVAIRYEGYLKRQARTIAQFRDLEDRPIPRDFDYRTISNLRYEAIERWSAVRPINLGQASRVSGIHPTDVSVLIVRLAALERMKTSSKTA